MFEEALLPEDQDEFVLRGDVFHITPVLAFCWRIDMFETKVFPPENDKSILFNFEHFLCIYKGGILNLYS